MTSEFIITLKTGGDLSDNEIGRLRELIWEALHPIAEEHMADLSVTSSWVIPGPRST